MQGSENTAHLKGKLSNMTETCRQLHENLNTHKKEVQILRSEKETLENVLTMKCQDTRKALTNELHRVQEEINRHYGTMRAESVRLNQQLGNLKTEKTALEKEIVRMTKRVEELEDAIGKDSDDDQWMKGWFICWERSLKSEESVSIYLWEVSERSPLPAICQTN